MSKIAYLTIDDAPSPDALNKLDFLTEKGIFAVWFCQGNFLEARPDFGLEIIRRGHWIGNHTYSHPACSSLERDRVFAEIRATDAVINDLYRQAGVERPYKLFRFPYGDKGDGEFGSLPPQPDTNGANQRAAIQTYLRKLGYELFPFRDITYNYYHSVELSGEVDWLWTYDSYDWTMVVSDPPEDYGTHERILARLDEDMPDAGRGLSTSGSAEIVLQHDYPDNNALFRRLIERQLEKGLLFMTPQP